MALCIFVMCPVAVSVSFGAQRGSTPPSPRRPLDQPGRALDQLSPELDARLIRLERAQGVFLGALIKGDGTIDQADVLRRVRQRALDLSSPAQPDGEADRAVDALGPRAAAIIRDGHRFHREVLAIIGGVSPSQRRVALDAAVQRYRSGRQSLADAPKDMAILYDHKYTSFVAPKPPATEPTRSLKYAPLTGLIWATHWYELAAVEPLDMSNDMAAREQGLATIAARLSRMLSAGEPPDGYPTELPLAPAIAPGLVAANERAAAIIDNLDMMLSVIEDVLVHPGVADRRAAVDQVVAQFTDRQYRCVQNDEWIVVALRHSIFDQGGFALAPMPRFERNAFGHGQHYVVKRAPPACDPE